MTSNWLVPRSSGICRNNLVIGNVGSQIANCAHTSNIISGTAISHFGNASPSDFHLVTASTARFSGINLTTTCCTTDRDGISRPGLPTTQPWDTGAYQYVTITPPPDTPPLEDFQYVTSVNLGGQNCTNNSVNCDNWTGPWIDPGCPSVFTVEAAPAGSFSGGNAATSQGTTQACTSRTFTAIGTGSIVWQMRKTVNNAGYSQVSLQDTAGAEAIVIALKDDGHIHACADYANDTDLGAYSASTFYMIEANLNVATNVNQYRVKIETGSYSSFINFCQATASSQVSKFFLFDNTAASHTFSVDSIGRTGTGQRPRIFAPSIFTSRVIRPAIIN